MYFINIKPEKVVKVYSAEESHTIAQLWMNIFCKNKQGVNTKAYTWHIFSGGRYPSINGDDALSAYENHISPQYVVMSNDGCSALLINEKPINLNFLDVNIFPENMAWSMSFTHEEGWLGPYFAKHPQYAQREIHNKKLAIKLEQIRIAESKGWV